MRIAQVAPLYEACPPSLYGGTEEIVSYLTECLVGSAMTSPCLRAAIADTRGTVSAAARRFAGRHDPRSHGLHMAMFNRVAHRRRIST